MQTLAGSAWGCRASVQEKSVGWTKLDVIRGEDPVYGSLGVTADEKQQRGRMPGLDLVRSLAIAMVVLGHGLWWYEAEFVRMPRLAMVVQMCTMAGVDGFFALSGFLVSRQLLMGWGRPGPFLIGFWLRRWVRIVPLYLLFLVLNLVVWRLAGNPWPSFVRYLTFTQNLFHAPPPFFPESWSLTVEVWCYLLLPGMAGLLPWGWSPQRRLMSSALVLILVALCSRWNCVLSPVLDWDGGVRKVGLFRLDAIGIGACVGLAFGECDSRFKTRVLAGLGMVVFCLFGALLLLMALADRWWMRLLLSCVFTLSPVAVALALPWVARFRSLPRGVGRLATWGAALAYPMYLANLWVRGVVGDWLIPRQVPLWAVFLVYLVGTVAVAMAAHGLVERPLLRIRGEAMLRWIRRRWFEDSSAGIGADAGAETHVIGWHRAPTGIGEMARSNVVALAAVGHPVRAVDLAESWSEEKGARTRRRIHLLNVNADGMDGAMRRTGAGIRVGDVVVGNWFWETERFPDRWRGELDRLSELWVASQYLQSTFGAISPCPVVRMRPAVLPTCVGPERLDVEQWMPRSRFNVFYAFDVMSVVERKNPFGVIEAYRRAFGKGSSATRLVLKVHQLERAAGLESSVGLPPDFELRLRREMEEIGGILITRSLPRSDMAALMGACDVYLSLHRSEGFGLTLAEAMMLGRPCIATGYSGNLDFMNAGNSHLVAWRRVTLDRSHGPYEAGTSWAEPDLDHAASLLVRVRDDPEEAKAKATLAREQLQRDYSPEVVGRAMVERLERLGMGRVSHA
jgi:peptidoglycan/LPS O-acetylase OafA/YrhL/glycosyltransferase involved in cell wall biosynthesis